MFTFDRFEPGASYGEHRFDVSPAEVAAWCALFGGAPSSFMPAGMVSVIVMRAYLTLVTPRPPGNIHGASRFALHRRVRVGDVVITRVACESKEVRKGRRIVNLALDGRAGDGPAFEARVTSLVTA